MHHVFVPSYIDRCHDYVIDFTIMCKTHHSSVIDVLCCNRYHRYVVVYSSDVTVGILFMEKARKADWPAYELAICKR
jgi:hypothetical protein